MQEEVGEEVEEEEEKEENQGGWSFLQPVEQCNFSSH